MESVAEVLPFNDSQKRAFLILLCAMLYFHGLEDEEEDTLLAYVKKHKAEKELPDVLAFVKEDVANAYSRAQQEIIKLLAKSDEEEIVYLLREVWSATTKKGYITEIEANAMLSAARHWKLDQALIDSIRNK